MSPNWSSGSRPVCSHMFRLFVWELIMTLARLTDVSPSQKVISCAGRLVFPHRLLAVCERCFQLRRVWFSTQVCQGFCCTSDLQMLCESRPWSRAELKVAGLTSALAPSFRAPNLAPNKSSEMLQDILNLPFSRFHVFYLQASCPSVDCVTGICFSPRPKIKQLQVCIYIKRKKQLLGNTLKMLLYSEPW